VGEPLSVITKKGDFPEDDDVIEIGLLPTKDSSLVLRILRCREQIKEVSAMCPKP
jgi:hypothetical protein